MGLGFSNRHLKTSKKARDWVNRTKGETHSLFQQPPPFTALQDPHVKSCMAGCHTHRDANAGHPLLRSRQQIDNSNAAEFQADPGMKDFWHTDLDLCLLSCQLLLPSALGLAEFALADGLYIVPCLGTHVEVGLLGLWVDLGIAN